MKEQTHTGLNADECFKKGVKLFERELWFDAKEAFTSTISLNPQVVDAYFYRGFCICKLRLDDNRSAIADYDEAIRLAPNFAEAYYNRGICKSNSKDNLGAIDDYTKAIHLNPKFAEAYYNRGICRMVSKNYREAVGDYAHAIDYKPYFAEAYNHLGICHAKLGEDYEAIRCYDKAIEHKPNLAEAYYNRFICNSVLINKKDEAEEDYDMAIKLNPKFERDLLVPMVRLCDKWDAIDLSTEQKRLRHDSKTDFADSRISTFFFNYFIWIFASILFAFLLFF